MSKEIKEGKTPLQTYWELEVKDKNGKLISKKQVEARSWLRQFIAILKGEFATRHGVSVGDANVVVVDEAGSNRNFPCNAHTHYSYYEHLATLADVADVTQGIIVGSGNTPNTLLTYQLQTKILHGSTTGLLVYGGETIEDVTNPSGLDLQFRITRTFTNNTGTTITVKEIGLLVKIYDASDTSRMFLIARDVLPSPTDVPDGATLTIRYVVKITIA